MNEFTAAAPPLPLTMLEAGQRFRVSAVCGGCGASERLADLGLLNGTVAQVVRPSCGGPMLLEVRGSRLAIGRGLASKLLVQVASPAEAFEPAPAPAFPVPA